MQPHPSKKRCVICGGPLTLHQEVSGGLCGNPLCARRRIQAEPRRRALAYRDELAVSLGLQEPASLPCVVVPAAVLSVGNLSARRSRRFRDHLLRVLGEADAQIASAAPFVHNDYPPPIEVTERQKELLGRACGICRGNCCMTGRNQAWLDVSAMRRFRMSHTELRPRHVLDYYLGRLPARHCVGSCVYHTASGCVLARETRGSVCNNYYCPGLQELWAVLEGPPVERVLVVAMDGFHVVRSGLLETGSD